MEGRCPACGHTEAEDSSKPAPHDPCRLCGFRLGPRLSELKICQCEPAKLNPVKRQSGGPVTCSRCDGFFMCEFCLRDRRDIQGFPLAFFVVAEKKVCPDHMWRATAIDSRS